MAAAVADLQHLPNWPRLLSPDQAAAYCGVSAPTFAAWCPVEPLRLGKRVLYDRRKIDLWLDKGEHQPLADSWAEDNF